MPTFNFHGRNQEGTSIKGRRIAQSVDALAQQLIKEGIIPVNIEPEESKIQLWDQLKKIFKRKTVTLDDLSLFSRQMYTLVSSGVPLTLALKQLAQTATSALFSEALFDIVEDLESGKDLAVAMQTHPEVFSPLMMSMVQIGQNSGRLDEAFLNLNNYLELESGAFKQLKSAIRYPITVLISIFAAIIIVGVFVIPTFAGVFAQANIKLPLATRALITISTFIITFWPYILVLVILSIIGVIYYLRTPNGRYRWDKLQLNLPLLGTILHRILLLRFTQSFSVIVKSGIPLIDGLGLVSQSMQNAYAKSQIEMMQSEVKRGKTLTQAATSISIFTPLELQMFSVSEETGELGVMLEQLALFHKREIDYSLKRLSDIVEPVLIIFLAGLILVLAIAVYMPIWNMVQLVHT